MQLPPDPGILADGSRLGGWWHAIGDSTGDDSGRILCDLCPRACQLKPGDRGFCFVRENRDGQMVLNTYGRSTGFCIDPIEKKPLNHFFPGTSVLSFGTAGCNLGCKFCQNWDISKSREIERLSEYASPEMIAAAAERLGCRSVAYTYNDPVIWAEYAIDTAQACRRLGVKNVAVTAGYICPEARPAFFHAMDAANVDLKAFTEDFYYKITYSHLQPVLETLEWLHRESDVWFEITNLIIPDANDRPDELRRMCQWILRHVGDEVPVHFTAFHPDFRMRDRPATPVETLLEAYRIAREQGLKYVYVGNVNDVQHQSTYCPACGQLVIERNWYVLGTYALRNGYCGHCGAAVAGHFDERPGDWGSRRMPVRISDYRPQAAGTPPPRDTPSANVATVPEPAASKAEQHGGTPTETSTPTSTPREGEATRMSGTSRTSTTLPAGPLKLEREQEAAVMSVACRAVRDALTGRRPEGLAVTLGSWGQATVWGAFVTLKRQGQLRSCCGVLGQPMPLAETLVRAAWRTATEDTRLPPISLTELPYLDIDVSLLHNFQPVSQRGAERLQAVEVGRHGLTIQRAGKGGLLLPVVPVEHGWDAEAFLRHVANKAGLPTTAWMDDEARLQTFEAYVVEGVFDGPEGTAAAGQVLEDSYLGATVRHCQANIELLRRGATPNYYLPEVPDGTVQGIVLEVVPPGQESGFYAVRYALRPGLPLQSTLFALCEAAARHSASGQVRLTVAGDSAMHGTLAAPDLRGLDPDCRALLMVENGHAALVMDPACSAAELLEQAERQLQPLAPAQTSLYSLAVSTNAPRVSVGTRPRGAPGQQVRPAAVAGTFYPGDAVELRQLVESLFPSEVPTPEAWPAVMVPHAGLMYSGRIAAQVFSHVQLPRTMIIIGPKHTRLGVPWAVAPQEYWQIPGARLACDVELARRLCGRIEGLQLDAAAHQQEHAIEVELPLLAQAAPHSRVVGVVIGGGSLPRLHEFAEGLAEIVRTLDEPPLLVISSDMNHFATDAENRRLDRIALDALATMDPDHLYRQVQEHQISMCGVLPAVVVLSALRQLNRSQGYREVAYGTSADVSGDTSRVVGYAGCLLGG